MRSIFLIAYSILLLCFTRLSKVMLFITVITIIIVIKLK